MMLPIFAVIALCVASALPASAAARGELLALTRTGVLGWAYDPDRPEHRVRLAIRLRAAGAVLHEATSGAELPLPGHDRWFQDGRGHGFRIPFPPGLPSTTPVMVELRLEDGPGAWHTELVAAMPSDPSVLLASIVLSQLHVQRDPAAGTLRVFVRTDPAAIPDGLALAVSLGAGEMPSEAPLDAATAGEGIELAGYRHATLSPPGDLVRDAEEGRPLLVAVWVSATENPGERRLVAATEVIASPNAPEWALTSGGEVVP